MKPIKKKRISTPAATVRECPNCEQSPPGKEIECPSCLALKRECCEIAGKNVKCFACEESE